MKTKLFAFLAAQLALIGALIFFLLPAIPASIATVR
jgi:hypothetical protein